MRNMELFKFKRDFDLLEYDLNVRKYIDCYKSQMYSLKCLIEAF